MTTPPLRIGTRRSALAQWQAEYAKWLIEERTPGLTVELIEIVTTADQHPSTPILALGGKGVFTKELEEALLSASIDCAVHSAKDMPATLPEGLTIGAVLERGDPRDVLISRVNKPFSGLPSGAKIGTSSLRRVSQLKVFRSDVTFMPIRGNIDTRIEKMDRGECDAIVIAAAAAMRLGTEHRISEYFETNVILPAPAQGAIAIECRANDARTHGLLEKVGHAATHICVAAERSFLRHLGGDCSVPVGCLATLESAESSLHMQTLISDLDGKRMLLERGSAPPAQAEDLAAKLAERILNQGGQKILAELKISAR